MHLYRAAATFLLSELTVYQSQLKQISEKGVAPFFYATAVPKCVNGGINGVSILNQYFLDDFITTDNKSGKDSIINLLSENVLGKSQSGKLISRYRDMFDNFENVTHDALSFYPDASEWIFSPEVRPYGRGNKSEYYQDTNSVPIPITHPLFQHLRKNFINELNKNNSTVDGAVIGLDLPTWFNMSSDKRIVIVAQDPLRDPKWYFECEEAICSTPFGQHSREYRDKGGKRFYHLLQTLIEKGYGIYLTDAYKYYLCGWSSKEKKKIKGTLTKDLSVKDAYCSILLKEIDIIRPSLIVTLGNAAKNALSHILKDREIEILNLPHFSGAAQGRIVNSKKYLQIKEKVGIEKNDNSVKVQSIVYAYCIEHNQSI